MHARYRFAHLFCLVTISSTIRYALPFTTPATHKTWRQNKIRRCPLTLSPSDDWSTEEDGRMKEMRNILENSWNGKEMGTVPSSPEKAAEAAAESIAVAMGQSHNVLMVDLRLPSYDITEGSRLYDKKAIFDFCTSLSDKLRGKKLITKSLILLRNEEERSETQRAHDISSEADVAINQMDNERNVPATTSLEASDDVAEFRKTLMKSWDTPVDDSLDSSKPDKSARKPTAKPRSDPHLSYRLWSMIGNEDISTGSDMFDQVIAAVDKHARLIVQEQEDALIIVSPYDTVDVIAVRRILARYGNTRTIILVNSRMETLPVELNNAVMVYGVMVSECFCTSLCILFS